MPGTDTALIIALGADIRSLKKSMQDGVGISSKAARQIEQRHKKMVDTIDRQTGDIGKKFAALTVVGVAAGMATLVSKSLEAASSIGETAIKAGVSTKKLQELRFAASQTGSSFENMDTALIFFNKNFGELLNTGKGKLENPFKKFGLDKDVNSGKIRTSEQALDAYLAKVAEIGDASQRAAYLAAGFGKNAGPQMAEMLSMGSAGMAALVKQANDLGIVLSDSSVQGAKEAKDKLTALFNVIEAQGVSAVAALAPEIANLADQLKDAMPKLILWVEKWLEWGNWIHMSPTMKLKSEIADLQEEIASFQAKKGQQGWLGKWDALQLFTVSDSQLDAFISDAQKRLAAKTEKLAHPNGKGHVLLDGVTGNVGKDPMEAGLGRPGRKHIPNPNAASEARAAEAEYERSNKEAMRNQKIISSIGFDAVTAQAALAVATDRAAVDMLKSTSGYYAAAKKLSDDELKERLAAIGAEKHAKLAQLDENAQWKMTGEQHRQAYQNIQNEFDAKASAAKTESGAALFQTMGGEDLDARTRGFAEYRSTLGMTTDAAERYIVTQHATAAANDLEASGDMAVAAILREKLAAYIAASKGAEEATAAMQRDVQVSDTLRQGLEDIDTAGLHGFSSMKSAAASLLEQMAQMIIKLYVMKPLIEGLFGESGTPLSLGSTAKGGTGGIVQSVTGAIKGLFGYASGGSVRGPGGPKADGVLARLSSGEFVVNSSSANRFRGLLEQINNGAIPGFATGGIVSNFSTPERGPELIGKARVK